MGDDLDHLLDEIELLFAETKEKTTEKTAPIDLKCVTPFIGPPQSRSVHKPCPALRCIQCDFAVLELPSAKWLPDTDYMFLRTNMPYAWKLGRQLEKCSGSIAYACQCSHLSTTLLRPITDFPLIQWTCRGHTNH